MYVCVHLYTCILIHIHMHKDKKFLSSPVHSPCVIVVLALKRSITIFWHHPVILFRLCCIFAIQDSGSTEIDINWRLREVICWLVGNFAISYDFERPPLPLIGDSTILLDGHQFVCNIAMSLHLRCCCYLWQFVNNG